MSRARIMMWTLLATLLTVDAGALELLVPQADVSIGENHLVLVGRADSDSVHVSLNGAAYNSFAVDRGFFHAFVELNVGLHELEIAPGGGGPVASLRVLAGPKIDRSYAQTFVEYKFHGAKPMEACASCHDPAVAARDVASQTGWCMRCHPDVPTKFTRHAGKRAVSCGDCHQINKDLTVAVPRSHADANPCYGCHQDKIGEFAQEYIHGPVAGGACTICHDPHGGDFASTLNQPAVLLCLSCHEDQLARKAEVPHQPFENGQCVDCHDPHSTRNRWVLVRSSEQLCLTCHGADGEIASHQHPYNVKPRRKLEVALRLTPSGRLECLSCHEAHGGSQRAMLRSPTPDLCIGCHPGHW